jgi:hypothetical protein
MGWFTFQVLEVCKPDKELLLALEQSYLDARPYSSGLVYKFYFFF